MSKGSTQRPTDMQKFNDNFDRIFGKKTEAMWEHYCVHGGYAYLPVGYACSICDEEQPDGNDTRS